MATKTGIFEWIGGSMDQTLHTFISITSSRVIEDFTLTVTIGGTLYLTMVGYMMITGTIEQSASHFLKTCGKFLLISGLAMNADTYMSWVVESLRGLETGVTAAFTATSDPSTSDSVFQVIDKAMSDGWQIGADMLSKMGQRHSYEIGMIMWDGLNALIVYAATLLIAVPAGAMIIVAKGMLSIMLGIGPVFIMMLLFGQFTSKWFDSWFAQVITYIMQTALVSTVLSFGIKYFSSITASILANPTDYPIATFLELLVTTIVVLYMMYQAHGVAGDLAGGISSAALTLRGIANGAMAPITRGLNRQSTRRDMQSGQMVTAGRLNHLAAGNTAWNPAYRQHVMQNMGKNWGSATGGKVNQ
ncbi:type IV secretion system protein [Pseudomonas trivialis]|uniref:type IV secretion system protein n=1 Tax=Pseudomonas trivialis TaxID=200450 RepID=UPI0030CF56FE